MAERMGLKEGTKEKERDRMKERNGKECKKKETERKGWNEEKINKKRIVRKKQTERMKEKKGEEREKEKEEEKDPEDIRVHSRGGPNARMQEIPSSALPCPWQIPFHPYALGTVSPSLSPPPFHSLAQPPLSWSEERCAVDCGKELVVLCV